MKARKQTQNVILPVLAKGLTFKMSKLFKIFMVLLDVTYVCLSKT